MRVRNDERAQERTVPTRGLDTLVIAPSVRQVTSVSGQNADTVFTHDRWVHERLYEVRTAILETAAEEPADRRRRYRHRYYPALGRPDDRIEPGDLARERPTRSEPLLGAAATPLRNATVGNGSPPDRADSVEGGPRTPEDGGGVRRRRVQYHH